MNSIPASVFILCIVKLEEFCYKYDYHSYSVLADLLISACKADGSGINTFNERLSEIRNSQPFLALDLSQETFVYSTFKYLNSGV